MHRWIIIFCLSLWLLPKQTVIAAAELRLPTQTQPSLTRVRANSRLDTTCTSQSGSTTDQSLVQKESCNAALQTMTMLVNQADLILRGRVTAVQSFWSADHRIIESDATLAVSYPLLGHAPTQLTVRTPGGFLPAEGIGMSSVHAAAFTEGEEVLLFVHQQGEQWQVVNGGTGKFVVEGATVTNTDLAFAQPLAGLLPTVVELIGGRGVTAPLPAVWQNLQAPTVLRTMPLLGAQSSERKWSTPHAAATFYINLNTMQIGDDNGDHAAFRDAILAAAASWSTVASADFTLQYAGETTATQTAYNGVNEVLFMHKGAKERAAAAQVWYTAEQRILEADIWINEDYAWNATGHPATHAVDLQSALVHEFGHWLVLGHFTDPATIMFPRLTAGTLKRTLQAADIQGISVIYPR